MNETRIDLRSGHYGSMDVQTRGGATTRRGADLGDYDGIPEYTLIVTGPGQFRVYSFHGDGFEWGPWLDVPEGDTKWSHGHVFVPWPLSPYK